jgi:hypothetical protein
MAQQHLALAKVRMLRCITPVRRGAIIRSKGPVQGPNAFGTCHVPEVRCGSNSEVAIGLRHFRLSPRNGHRSVRWTGPVCAKSGNVENAVKQHRNFRMSARLGHLWGHAISS